MYKVYHAETVDEAIEKGLRDLNVTENDIRIDVIEAGKRGIFGLGKRDAEVKLTVINPDLKTYESIDSLKTRETVLDDEANITDKDTVQEENVTEEDFSEEEARDEVDAVSNEAIEVPTKIIEDETLVEENEEEKEAEKNSEEETLTDDEVEEDTIHPKFTLEEAAESTMNYVHEVVTEMGIENSTTYTIEDKEINIELESDFAAKIIGKRGATLNALQEIAQQYFNRIYTSYGRIIIDTENYRMKREETLETLAMNMTKKALRTGLPVHLEPMPAKERKIIHNALSNVTNVKTYSQGEEPNRYLVIEKI